MTEDQAITKLCPYFLGIATTTAMEAYRNGALEDNEVGLSITGGSRCVASDCMMWQWSTLPDGEPEYTAKAIGGGHFENAPCGYCGLANKP